MDRKQIVMMFAALAAGTMAQAKILPETIILPQTQFY